MNYYPFHIGDYLSATRHLSWEEDAAYRRLLDVYYTTEKPIPADHKQACRLVLATTETQRDAVQTVLVEFFELTESGWINGRADAEIEAMREKQQKQRDRANKRWQKPNAEPGNAPVMPRHAKQDATASNSDANAMPPTPTPTPTPTPNKKNTPQPPKGGCRRFEEFWTAWPKGERKQDKVKCAEKWRRGDLDEQADRILADIEVKRHTEKWREGYIEAPLVYLNGRRWEDGVTPAEPGQQGVADPESRAAIEAEGERKGLGLWNEASEQWHVYKARVRGGELGGAA